MNRPYLRNSYYSLKKQEKDLVLFATNVMEKHLP